MGSGGRFQKYQPSLNQNAKREILKYGVPQTLARYCQGVVKLKLIPDDDPKTGSRSCAPTALSFISSTTTVQTNLVSSIHKGALSRGSTHQSHPLVSILCVATYLGTLWLTVTTEKHTNITSCRGQVSSAISQSLSLPVCWCSPKAKSQIPRHQNNAFWLVRKVRGRNRIFKPRSRPSFLPKFYREPG